MENGAHKNSIRIWLLLALTVFAGTFAALALTNQSAKYLTFALPLALPLASFSFMALSSLCVWGLLFTIPMFFLGRAALRGASFWRVCLPMLFLEASMTIANQMISGDVPWRTGAPALAIALILLFASILAGGLSNARKAISSCWNEMRGWMAKEKAESEAEELARKADEAAKKADAGQATNTVRKNEK